MQNTKSFRGAVSLTFLLFLFCRTGLATETKDFSGPQGVIELRNLEKLSHDMNAATADEEFGDTVGVQTKVRVPDQHTQVLGGNAQTAAASNSEGVPVLSKIPLLGRLFRSRRETNDEQTLLIVTKPVIIDSASDE